MALKPEFLPISPHSPDVEDVVDGQTQRTTTGSHTAGQDISESWHARQTGWDGLAVGEQGLKHIPHPTSTTHPDRVISALPDDPIELRSQIKSPLVLGRCQRTCPTTADPQRPRPGPAFQQIG
jgi:hypothetical protein